MNRRTFSRSVAFATILLCASVAVRAEALSLGAAAKALDSPNGGTTAGNFGSKALLQADTDKTTATFSASKQLAWANSKTNFGSIGLTAKSPFDSSKDTQKDLGSISGLTAGTNARLDVTFWHWPAFSRLSVQDIEVACADVIPRIYPGTSWSTPTGQAKIDPWNLAAPPFSLSCLDLIDPDKLQANIEAINVKAKARADKNKDGEPKVVQAGPDAHTLAMDSRSRLLADEAKGTGLVWGVTVSGTGNSQKFTYASMDTPSKTTSETDFGRGLSLTFTGVLSSTLISAGGSYERAYAGGAQAQICTPIGATGATQCSNGSLQSPKNNVSKLVYVEIRSVIPGWSDVAVSPRVEYDTDSYELGVALPIYFIHSSTRVLDGGIQLGWTTKDHMSAGVFVGKAFALFQ